jgi:hypothetical protein
VMLAPARRLRIADEVLLNGRAVRLRRAKGRIDWDRAP